MIITSRYVLPPPEGIILGTIIKIRNLVKRFGEVIAIDGINLDIEEGETISLLGSNDSGKTSLMRILGTFSDMTSGRISIDGFEVGVNEDENSIRKRIGFVFAHSVLDPNLTLRENLETRASLYPRNADDPYGAAEDAAAAVNLSDYMDKRYSELNIEQKRRADIARALVGNPKILVIDEPTVTLDPGSRVEIWEVIHSLRASGKYTMIISTVLVAEAGRCDRIVIMDHGKILDYGTPIALKERYSSDKITFIPRDVREFTDRLDEDGIRYKATTITVTVNIENTMAAIPLLDEYESYLEEFEVMNGSLEDTFVNAVTEKGGRR